MYAPMLSTLFLLMGGAAATAIHSDEHFAALLARQAPGTPKYECHANCGAAITGGRVSGYCSNSTWLDAYNYCLSCAEEFDIWQYYGSSVGAAGTACGLSTEAPSSPSSTSTDGPVSVTTTSDAPATETTTTDSATTPETTAQPTADSSTADVPASTSESATAAETTTAPPTAGAGSNTTSSAPSASSTFVTVSGARGTDVTASLLGLGAMVALGLKALW
ncbi:hypothetical protein NKR19_g2499 [Coniochaeta hoffmannii]|uniref:Uncharacterized protein n=1 Tax=Coniochaeta hoffmannii TaxID=91930 RepID=A0AA38SIJ7_9PEZI|nr:hypothetical protein NKR19_g2499 [Coniochaeta hoffmannii]